MFPGGIGTSELLIIGIVAILLFGSKLPDVARNFGKSYQQLRRSLSELHSSFSTDIHYPGPNSSRTEKITHYKDAADETEPAPPRFQPPSDANTENG